MEVDYGEWVYIVLQSKGLYIIFKSRRIMAFNRKERVTASGPGPGEYRDIRLSSSSTQTR